MISDIKYMFDSVMLLLSHKFIIYGFSISFLDIFLLSLIVGVVGKVLYELFAGD